LPYFALSGWPAVPAPMTIPALMFRRLSMSLLRLPTYATSPVSPQISSRWNATFQFVQRSW